MISGGHAMQKADWEEQIPKYMCERAQRVMEKLHSPLVDVLTESTLSKMFTLQESLIGSWGPSATVQSVSFLIQNLMESSLRERDAISLFYVLFVVFVNMDEFREQYLYYGRNELSGRFQENRPALSFSPLLSASFLPADHPLHQMLLKLRSIYEEMAEAEERSNTVSWDFIFSSLLVKVTASRFLLSLTSRLSIYESSRSASDTIGLSDSPIVLHLLFLSLQTVLHRTESQGGDQRPAQQEHADAVQPRLHLLSADSSFAQHHALHRTDRR